MIRRLQTPDSVLLNAMAFTCLPQFILLAFLFTVFEKRNSKNDFVIQNVIVAGQRVMDFGVEAIGGLGTIGMLDCGSNDLD